MLIFKWGKCCYWFQYCKKRKEKKKTAAVLGFPDTVLSRVCDGQQFVGGEKKNPSTCHRDMSEEGWPESFKLTVKAKSKQISAQ